MKPTTVLLLLGLSSASLLAGCPASRSGALTMTGTTAGDATALSTGGSSAGRMSAGSAGRGTAGSSGSGSTSGGGAPSQCSGVYFFCDDQTASSLWGQYTTRNGLWTRKVGQTAVQDSVQWQRARAMLPDLHTDFDATVTGYSAGDSGFGLVYGGSAGADDGYAVLIHPGQFQGVYLKRLVPGQPDVTLAHATLPSGTVGVPYRLRVQRHGGQVTVGLNGATVLTGNDGNPGASGQLGLLEATTDNTSGAGAVFTLLRVDSANVGSGASSSAAAATSTTTAGTGLGLSTSSGAGGTTGPTGTAGSTGGVSSGATLTSGGVSSGTGAASTSGGSPPVTVPIPGAYLDADCTAFSAFRQWLGKPPGSVGNLIYDPGGSIGPGVAVPTVAQIESALTANQCGEDAPQMVSVGFGDTADNMLAGTYDSYYVNLGTALAAVAPRAFVRVAWEFNGYWFDWGIQNGAKFAYTAAQYAAVWQHVVPLVRNVPGAAGLKFDWCPDVCPGCPDPEPAYPGDPYVDIIGLDIYDTVDTGNFAADWSGYRTSFRSLEWQVAFAQAHGKGLSLPEWGVGYVSGALDDGHGAQMVSALAAWLKNTNNVNGYQPYKYFDYWDTNEDYCGVISSVASSACPPPGAYAPTSYGPPYQLPQSAEAFLDAGF